MLGAIILKIYIFPPYQFKQGLWNLHGMIIKFTHPIRVFHVSINRHVSLHFRREKKGNFSSKLNIPLFWEDDDDEEALQREAVDDSEGDEDGCVTFEFGQREKEEGKNGSLL